MEMTIPQRCVQRVREAIANRRAGIYPFAGQVVGSSSVHHIYLEAPKNRQI
jgi:hypothetical protein